MGIPHIQGTVAGTTGHEPGPPGRGPRNPTIAQPMNATATAPDLAARMHRGVLLPYPPSDLQRDIFDFGAEGTGHGVIEAVAGSGKSTVLEGLANFLTGSVLAIAFNRSIRDALKVRFAHMPQVTAATIHSTGYSALRKGCPRIRFGDPDDRKYDKITKDYLAQIKGLTPMERREGQAAIVRLVELSQLNLIDPADTEAMERIAIHHDVKGNGWLQHVPAVQAIGLQQAERGIIDYNEMIFLPIFWGLYVPQYDNVLVDECQDLNACQREIAFRSCKGWHPDTGVAGVTGRMFFVGDRAQAIYGFAAADAQSFQNIIDMTGAKVLPLSICYRCPTSHLDLARELVPQIQPRPNAPEGSIGKVKEDDLAGHVQPGDLILSRTNAPLLTMCIELIGRRIQARIKGADVGKKLTGILRKIEGFPGFTFSAIGEYIERWADGEVGYLVRKDASEAAIDRVRDMQAALDVCVRGFIHAGSVDGVCREIDALFAHAEDAVWLSSVHRAKGLEARRVYVYNPDMMPLRWRDQQPWELAQEYNIKYVAYTRAKDALTFIISEN